MATDKHGNNDDTHPTPTHRAPPLPHPAGGPAGPLLTTKVQCPEATPSLSDPSMAFLHAEAESSGQPQDDLSER